MGGCCSNRKSVDLPTVPPAPAKQRTTTLPDFPIVANNNSGISSLGAGGVTNRALEED
ncbi:uncharacterized protein Dmoj_GI25552 [Drosophila mojavensis]|uniref:Uncharacterized protein n=1 Tax=Drosophila mojavensis TaxID=7230 RepID=A0A0Q9XDJ8_DROMO|nr:uncharacterized protein Dmoj_GI25552 [Drosophila mojavensis]